MGTEKPSKPEVKKENPEQKQKEVAKQPAELSAEKEKTEQRINKLETRLAKCPKLISNLPEGQIKEAAKEKYKEAKKLLEEAAKDLKNLALNAIEKIANNLEEEGKKMTKRIEDLQKIGVSEEYTKKYLSDNRCRANEELGLDKMVAFLTEASKIGVSHTDSFSMWKNVWEQSITEVKLLEILIDMKALGVTENFYAVYKSSNGKKEEYKKAADMINIINISSKELNKFYNNEYEKEFLTPENLSKEIDKMQEQGISKDFYDIYCVSKQIISPNLKRIAELISFKTDNSDSQVHELYKLHGETKDIKEYIGKFTELYLKNGEENVLSNAIDAYATENNINKVIDYISFLQKLGIDGPKNFRLLHELMPETKDIEKIPKEDIKCMENLGLDKVSSIILAKEKGKDAIPLDGGDWGIENFTKNFLIQGLKGEEITILHLLSKGNIEAAKEILSDNKTTEILKGGNDETIIIFLLGKTNMNSKEILSLWKTLKLKQDAKNIAMSVSNFLNYFPLFTKNLIEEKSVTSMYSNTNNKFYHLINTAINFDKFSQEDIKGFITDLINQHAQVELKNLEKFLSDPCLPLCIDISKILETPNRELALQIGRSLYNQGITTIPDRETLILKIKEWQELQEEVDKEYLWKDTNTIALFNNEKNLNGENRTNIENRNDSLKKSIGPNGSLSVFAPPEKPTPEELRQLKIGVLNKISTTKPPIRFIFNGHSDGKTLLFTSDNPKNLEEKLFKEKDFKKFILITVEELAKAVLERSKNFPDKLEMIAKETYIFYSCYNNDFIRKFYSLIQEQKGVSPRAIGQSEYGQLAWEVDDKMIDIYGFGKTGTTFGDVRKNQIYYTASNITIYAPNKKGEPQQIGQAKKPPDRRNT